MAKLTFAQVKEQMIELSLMKALGLTKEPASIEQWLVERGWTKAEFEETCRRQYATELNEHDE